MSTRSQLTKDLNESVKSLLARRVKILLKNVVKLEAKGFKTENKVLVFSPCRLFVLTSRVPTKIEFHFHYLEIQAVESKKLNQLCLTVGDKVYSFLTSEETSGETDAMIQALSTAMRQIFPTVPLTHIIRKVDIQPAQRLQHIRDAELAMRHTTPESRAIGPCGGFSTQYACMCDYHALPYREEVAWDVDNIYLAHGTRELNLKEFDYLDFKDLVAVISGLEYNTWFTSLRASGIKLSHDCMDRDFAHKLSLALIANPHSVLHTIDLSYNLIEDKGASSLCGILAKMSKGGSQLVSPISNVSQGLISLNLSHCGLTSKGVNQICHALTLNKTMDSTLTYLNLSDNSLKDDVTIFGALLRGCATNLVDLNVSRNVFSTKNSSKPGKQELPLSFKQFFTSALNLKSINIASCKLPLEALKHLLLGLACNESISQVSLDLSYNNLSSHGGAHVLESCIHGVRCLACLDLTETGMDLDLGSVLSAISKNKSLRTLVLNKNLVTLKAKHIGTVINALVDLIQDDDCSIQSLSIADCKLKNEMNNVLSALGTNNSLQVVDITGNFIGDVGARLLAKSLQINSSLHTLHYDRNNITLAGYSELAYGLEHNRTLKVLSYPTHDILPCMKLNAEKCEQVLRKIQTTLSRNMLRGGEEEASKGENMVPSSASMVLNNSNYILDQMIVQQKEIVKVVSEDEASTKANEINLALSLIEDAEHCKSLMSTLLTDCVQNIIEGNEVHAQFGNMAQDLTSSIHDYMQASTEAMLRVAKDQCPTVMCDARISSDLLGHSTNRIQSSIDRESIRRTLVDKAGAVINRKISVAETVSDNVIKALSKSYKSLLGDSKTRSSTPDVLRSISTDSSRNNSFLSSRSQSDSSPIVKDEDVSSSDGSSEEGKDRRTKPKTDDNVKGEEKNSRKTSEKESEEETGSDEESGKKNYENGEKERSDEDDTNNNKEVEDTGEKKSGRGNGKESNKDDTENESEEETESKTDRKETDVKKSSGTDDEKEESSEEESENDKEDDKVKKNNRKDDKKESIEDTTESEEGKERNSHDSKDVDRENVKTSTETSKSDGTSSDDNDVTVKRTGKKDTKHDQGKTTKDIENGKDKSDINVKRIAKDIVKDKEVSDEGKTKIENAKSSVNKDKEKVDEMKQSSKNLLEELRKKQGSKIEDKIKRLANKEVDRSERKITGLSKNVDLKAKLEENFKKHATKKGEEENLGKGLVNVICKDIIAAKKESMERRLDRSKVEETTPSVKKIQKLNLDLKSKLEQGLDFNKTRRTIAESLEKRRLTESTDNRRISGAIEKRLAESTEDGRVGNRLLAEPTEGLRRSRTTGEVEIGREREREDREVRRQTDLTRQVKSSLVLDLESVLRNKATPQLSSKRKSVNGRKLRPKSVVDTAERGSADDIPDLLPSLPTSAEESLDSVTELPGSSQLQHLVKSRPRRAKTRAPTRATPLLSAQNSIPRLEDEGLDSFFIATPSLGSGGGSVNHTPVLSPLSDDSSLSSAPDTPNHTAPSDPQTPSTASSHCFSNTTTGKTTTLPHLKSKVTSADDVPRSRSSDNVGTSAGFGKRANTVDLSEPFSDSTPTSASSVSKIDGTHHLKRNTKLTGTAVDLIKAKKSAVDSCKDSTNTSTESSTSSLSTSISTSTSNNITVSSIVKLRTAGLTDGLKSPTNGIPPKSPLPSKYSKEKGFEFGANADKSKGPTAALLGGAKPRPWSMMDHGEHKTDYKNLSALDINSSSGPSSLPLNINEKRSSVKAMAANLNKQGSESPEPKKKPTIEFPPPPSTGSGD
ncbi:hypothetical protein M8J76_012474 [Diaphorina citri]|nr:hypothetical protein M8J76_012474 [Diaphorina citri]